MESLTDLPRGEVEAFCLERGCIGLPSGQRDCVVAIPRELVRYLDGDKFPSTQTVRSFRSLTDLERLVGEILAQEPFARIEPNRNSLRHLFSLSGFIQAMNTLEQSFPAAHVIVPPGRYGQTYLFVLGHLASAEATDT